jgi:pyruvate formate lyase activating enzyme
MNVCKNKAIHKSQDNKRIDETKCDFCESCVRECYPEALQIVGREMSVEELSEEIRKDSDFYRESGGGVTFSGGEPFSQSDFLCEVLAACKGRGIHTAIETCGFVSWDILEKTTPNVDLFLYDIKSMDEKKHKELTGVSNELILENLEKLTNKSQVIVRVPLIPQINDDEYNIRRLGQFLSKLRRIEEVDLLPYHRLGISKYERLHKTYALREITPPEQDRVDDLRKTLGEFGFRINVGG